MARCDLERTRFTARAKEKLIFAHRVGKYRWLKEIENVDAILDPSLDDGEHELAGIDTTLVILHLSPEDTDQCRVDSPATERWFDLPSSDAQFEATPRFHAPSQIHTASQPAEAFSVAPEGEESSDGADRSFASAPTIVIEELPGPSHFPSGASEDQYAAIGNAVHAYLAALPSLRSLDDKPRHQIAQRCLATYGVTGVLSPDVLLSTGDRFANWVVERYPGARWHTEVPLTAPRAAGGQWIGTADLLLQLDDGQLILIDHKSAPIRREHCQAKAATYSSQLNAYAGILETIGETLANRHIHFPLAGVIATATSSRTR